MTMTLYWMEQISGTGELGNRLLLEDVMDGDTSGFLSGHGVTFSNNNLSLSGGIDGNLIFLHLVVLYLKVILMIQVKLLLICHRPN